MTAARDSVAARQVVLAKILFALYDALVLGFSNRFIWQCPTRRLLRLYQTYCSANHLEAGAGTGFFLDRCGFPGKPGRLVLLDLNGYCLAETAYRLRRYQPLAFRRDILQPFDLDGLGFDSIGMNYVLHCLPGTLKEKGLVFAHLRLVMNPGAVLFGATTLSRGIKKNVLARLCLSAYNKMGIFCNTDDSLDGLDSELQRHFSQVAVERIGCSGVFVCRR